MNRTRKRVLSEYLVLSAQGGDRKAGDQLVRLWDTDFLRHSGRLTGDAELARDTVQEAWIDIVRGLRRLSDPAAFPAWAYRIVTRKSARSITGLQKQRRLAAGLAAQPEPVERGQDMIECQAEAGPVLRALATLPDDQRTTVALFYLDDFSVAEIAVALSIPAGTVKTRLMHARRKLQAALTHPDQGGSHDRN